jgi:hypothetical protein
VNELLQRIGDVVVEQYQPYDMLTEDLIYGKDLKDGMVVLIESDGRSLGYRSYNTAELNSWLIMKNNRWCEVTRLFTMGDDIVFIALYGDGRKAIRITTPTAGWIVKETVEPSTETENKTVSTERTSFQNYLQAGN